MLLPEAVIQSPVASYQSTTTTMATKCAFVQLQGFMVLEDTREPGDGGVLPGVPGVGGEVFGGAPPGAAPGVPGVGGAVPGGAPPGVPGAGGTFAGGEAPGARLAMPRNCFSSRLRWERSPPVNGRLQRWTQALS